MRFRSHRPTTAACSSSSRPANLHACPKNCQRICETCVPNPTHRIWACVFKKEHDYLDYLRVGFDEPFEVGDDLAVLVRKGEWVGCS